MSKVFILGNPTQDYSTAEKYGELVFVTKRSISRLNTMKMIQTFLPFIKNADPQDYIIITGMTVMNVVFCSLFASKFHQLNLLIFQSYKEGGGKYYEKILTL